VNTLFNSIAGGQRFNIAQIVQ